MRLGVVVVVASQAGLAVQVADIGFLGIGLVGILAQTHRARAGRIVEPHRGGGQAVARRRLSSPGIVVITQVQ